MSTVELLSLHLVILAHVGEDITLQQTGVKLTRQLYMLFLFNKRHNKFIVCPPQE